MTGSTSLLADLEAAIAHRLKSEAADSYVGRLATAGHAAMSGELIEKTYALISVAGEADENRTPQDLTHAAADVLLHWALLYTAAGGGMEFVARDLRDRFQIP